jgi:hypothetical protein
VPNATCIWRTWLGWPENAKRLRHVPSGLVNENEVVELCLIRGHAALTSQLRKSSLPLVLPKCCANFALQQPHIRRLQNASTSGRGFRRRIRVR